MRKKLYIYKFTRDEFEIYINILFNMSVFISFIILFIYFICNDLFIKLFYNDIEDALHSDVDIWRDPRLDESIFMSAALKQALDKAKISKAWKLVSCKLIGAR